ncbi:MAG: RNA polymerase sigma-70 factor [Chloroflexota bacterium]|nr:RNA polymerase sigma-70 factor [Chloroflexota bacterium]
MAQEDVFEQHRPLLFGLAYRMLGSVMDAEDIVQEAFLRWHTAVTAEDAEPVRSPRTYLCTIVTRLCIDHLRSARAQRESYIGVWLPEPLVATEKTAVSDSAELAESLTMAFLMVLERLQPVERAVFLLRQVFDYEYAEIARIVGKSEANCRQIMRRAREHLAAGRQRSSLSAEQQERLTREFLRACMSGDLEGLMGMLADDVVLYADGGGKRAAPRTPVHGPDTIARFFVGSLRAVPAGFTVHFVWVNGAPGLVSYVDGAPDTALALDWAGDRVRGIYIVRNPEKLRAVPPAT